MASAGKIQLLFLPSKTPATQTRKSKHELDVEDQEARAHARSHASRIAWRRIGHDAVLAYGGQDRAHGPLEGVSTRSRWRLPVREHDHTSQKERSRNSQSPHLSMIKTGALDPFFRLPVDLDIQERNMLFYYLDRTRRVVYGVKRYAVFCPIRDCSVVNTTESPLPLQWMILVSEMMTGASKTAICTRRAAIYADTRKLLQNPETFLLDETLLLLLVASIAETRLGNIELATNHFTGLLQLLKLRNGLRTFQETGLHLGLSSLHGFVVGPVPLFHTSEELRDALNRMRLPRSRRPVPQLIRRYFEADSFNHGAHIGNLHLLNMVLAEEPEGYIDRLVHNITGSGDNLTPAGITFMIAQSAVEVNEWYGPNPLVRSWETIEFVRLLGYASILSKEATVKALSSWLTGEGCFDIDLGALKAEILEVAKDDLVCSEG